MDRKSKDNTSQITDPSENSDFGLVYRQEPSKRPFTSPPRRRPSGSPVPVQRLRAKKPMFKIIRQKHQQPKPGPPTIGPSQKDKFFPPNKFQNIVVTKPQTASELSSFILSREPQIQKNMKNTFCTNEMLSFDRDVNDHQIVDELDSESQNSEKQKFRFPLLTEVRGTIVGSALPAETMAYLAASADLQFNREIESIGKDIKKSVGDGDLETPKTQTARSLISSKRHNSEIKVKEVEFEEIQYPYRPKIKITQKYEEKVIDKNMKKRRNSKNVSLIDLKKYNLYQFEDKMAKQNSIVEENTQKLDQIAPSTATFIKELGLYSKPQENENLKKQFEILTQNAPEHEIVDFMFSIMSKFSMIIQNPILDLAIEKIKVLFKAEEEKVKNLQNLDEISEKIKEIENLHKIQEDRSPLFKPAASSKIAIPYIRHDSILSSPKLQDFSEKADSDSTDKYSKNETGEQENLYKDAQIARNSHQKRSQISSNKNIEKDEIHFVTKGSEEYQIGLKIEDNII